ncbi:MAG: hypothetical protein E7396_00165 [Ruminococcaceae bacterium]|nr:hypothetical protein [Oscillospiraceae bacterium]
MKRVIGILLMLIMTMGMCANAASDLGAYYTDIKSYINISAIASVNINGETYVLVEELDKYGFEVVWNEAERTLTVNEGEYIPHDELIKDEAIPGEFSFNARETDIRLIIKGTSLPCLWSEKGIITHFDNLGLFGTVRWYDKERKIRLTTGVYEYYVNFPDTVNFCFEEFPDVPTPEAVGAPKYETKYADDELSGVIYAYQRKNITKEMYDAYIMHLVNSGFNYRGNVNWDSNIWFEKNGRVMLIGVDDDYLYVKVFF